MQKAFLFVVALALGCDAPSAASESAELLLKPSDKWRLDFGDNRCRLARFFGNGEERHLLLLEQTGPSKTFSITFAGPGVDDLEAGTSISLQFGSLPPMDKESFFIGEFERFGPALILSNTGLVETGDEADADQADKETFTFEELDPEAADKTTQIALRQAETQIVFRTGALSAAFEAMNICTTDMLRHWGLDPDAEKTKLREPKIRNLQRVAQRIVRRYPSRALRKGEMGIVRARLLIDKSGRATDCHQFNATQMDQLESPACAELMRAEFDPALDKDGQPMSSYFEQTVAYSISK